MNLRMPPAEVVIGRHCRGDQVQVRAGTDGE